jgi:hypothetical protein
VLCLLGRHPLYIHKLHLQLSVAPEYYHTSTTITALPQTERNKGKQHLERMARADVNFVVYPNGKVMISIACSNNPFKLQTDEDVTILFSFLGQVRDRLITFLADRHERIVPDIMDWELTECDINKDIKVSDWFQYTGLKIQVRHLDHIFRIYIKSMGKDTVCRVEEIKHPKNKSVIEAINEIFNPTNEKQGIEERRQLGKIHNMLIQLVKGQKNN